MLTINDLLTKFKASGVYTIYEDKTVQARLTSSPILRLVIGYSKTGVFNRPVFIRKGDTDTATRIFGKRDRSLERKNSFFHKSLELALIEGDVLALNLWSLNNTVDVLGFPTSLTDTSKYISLSTDPISANGVPTTKLLASFYNKQKFWRLDRNYLLATRDIGDRTKILSFANVSQTAATVFVVKSDVKGYNITVKDWYGDKEIPKYLNPTDYIADYFLDVVVVNGNYGKDKWDILSQDPVFGAYFTKSGLIPTKLTEFISRKDVSVRDTYTGCIIPDFVDNNVSKFLEEIVNQKSDINGIMCAVDRKQLEDYETGTNTGYLDLVGHRLIDSVVTDCEFLSYNFKLNADYTFTGNNGSNLLTVSSTGVTMAYFPKKITVTILNSNPLFATLTDSINEGETLINGLPTVIGGNNGISMTNVSLEVSNVTKSLASIVFDLTSPLKDTETSTSGVFIQVDKTVSTAETLAESALITVSSPVINTHFKQNVDKNDGSPLINLVDYFFHTGDTSASVRTAIVNMINTNTYIHGFTAVADVDATKFKIVAPVGSGATANAYTFSNELISGTALYSNSGVLLTGGISEVYTFPVEPISNFFESSQLLGAEATVAGINHLIYKKWKAGIVRNGDKVDDGGTEKYIKITEVRDVDGIYSGNANTADYRKVLKITYFTDVDLTLVTDSPNIGDTLHSNGSASGGNEFVIIDTQNANMSTVIEAAQLSETSVQMDILNESTVKLYDYLVGFDVNDNKILTRIKKITRAIAGGGQVPNVINVTVEDKVYIYTDGSGSTTTKVVHYKPYKQCTRSLSPFFLEGFTPKEASMPDGTEDRLSTILSVFTTTNIGTALADPEMIDFRYFIDTFGNGLTVNSKSQMSALVKRRQKCLGILNMPSMSEFTDSQNPRFTTTPTPADPLPILDVQYIVDGGNTDENPLFLYTLPEEEQGASFVGFFGPHLKFLEGGQEAIIPPAALVSNNYIRKYTEGNPFKAVAGSRRGVLTAIGLTGVEHPLDKTERGLFEEKGLNPIYQKKDGSIVIYGIDTAYQKFSSSLNYLHARDTLISIEIDTEKLLDPYTFEDNDDNLKAEVSTVLSNYFINLRDSVGCIKSFELIFDANNNPDFLAKEGAALVDTRIELKDVARVFINRITIYRSGPVVSGGFVAI